MKLIVAGGTGYLATEVIRQSLLIPEITSIVVLARKLIQVDDGIGSSKLKTVVLQDYGEYSDDVKTALTGADACIWTVAVTPVKSRGVAFAEIKRICQDCALVGLKAMKDAGPSKPFRFVYLSGDPVPRDPTQKKPLLMGDYLAMRGETENMVLAYGKDHGIDVCVAKPGWITSWVTFPKAATAFFIGLTDKLTNSRAIASVTREELAAALLDQVVRGFEKEPLVNADLVRLGRAALKAR